MNTLIQFLAGMVANLLQRAFGSKPSTMLTITGFVGALSTGVGAFPVGLVAAKWQPWFVGAGMFLTVLAGTLGHGHDPNQNPLGLQQVAGNTQQKGQ